MALDGISKLGEYLGDVFQEQDNIDAQIAPDEPSYFTEEDNYEDLVIKGVVVGYRLIFEEDAFVIDHPVRGEIDSNYYRIDGAYKNKNIVFFDLTYPIYWDKGHREKIFEQVL